MTKKKRLQFEKVFYLDLMYYCCSYNGVNIGREDGWVPGFKTIFIIWYVRYGRQNFSRCDYVYLDFTYEHYWFNECYFYVKMHVAVTNGSTQ